MAITEGSPPEADFSTGYLTAKEKQEQLNKSVTRDEESKPPVHGSVKPEGWLKKLFNKIKSTERA